MSRWVVFLIVIVFIQLGGDVWAYTEKSSYFTVSLSPPKPLPSTQEASIKDGMTLKMIVANIGPGWMAPNEGVGVIHWFFDDGKVLSVFPHWDDSEVITFKGKGGLSRMWWGR
jgi:hypothetical protein